MTGLVLEPRLDLSTVGALAASLLAHAGADLLLDAGKVTHLGGLGLQVLLAAADEWRNAGHRFVISPRSTAFDEALILFGVDIDALQTEGTT
ncbi:STAS domain-containing protein [Phaeovulum sp.]|uniref:STAS domain-containing protein n=1 Tax=Phaeovulum sp. TaxID=2934796 RepID=UPI0039E25009